MNILSAIVLAGTLAACNSPAENLSGSGNGGGEISGEKRGILLGNCLVLLTKTYPYGKGARQWTVSAPQ